MSGHTVMVVDDSLPTALKLTTMLRELGYDVVKSCRDGAEAVHHYPLVRPALVTMDITMPDMNGIEATRRIIGHDPAARVVMVTSHGQEQMVLDALDAGARGYVLKPFKAERLDEVIRKILDTSTSD